MKNFNKILNILLEEMDMLKGGNVDTAIKLTNAAKRICTELFNENHMDKKYYYLKEGETIKEGDEVEVSNSWNDPAKWEKTNCVGGVAPNPNFPAHRTYRRLISE